ncbi:AhpD-like protein [Podospora didyma]|uniref:AhpD-like protein n=1 Tax=Podospora didyma TaxID=330526 RepID=A0AAE0NUW6_9PEZI|nr:AhpD-like protein [Podospora didyma]
MASKAQPSPPPPATVQLHALSAGHFSLPEEQFVYPSSGARSTVPSLCFLVQHTNPATGIITRIVFDLGLRRDVERYSEPIRRHVATRQPMTTTPDVVTSLQAGGLTPREVDYVVYSHVHWDHVGEPRDFPGSKFIVGHGALDLLQGTSSKLRGGHSFFEADLLDLSRTTELIDPSDTQPKTGPQIKFSSLGGETVNVAGPWKPLPEFDLPAVLDIFQDGSVYIVDAPGHLPGHINLLAQAPGDGGSRWVYLAGDTCHDRRIMRKEKEIGEWFDKTGQVCCIHADRAKAEETIERVRGLEERGVEVIFAHDVEWESDVGNRGRFFGALSSVHVVETNDFLSVFILPIVLKSQLKEDFIARLGAPALHSGWASLLSIDPEFFAASVSLAAVPRQKSHLSRKHQSLIALAVDSAATHLYTPGIRAHVTSALKEGATLPEILEVIELSSTLGIHACNIGVPLLVEVLKEEGKYTDEITKPFDDRQEQLKEEFTEKRGYWHTFWEDFLRLDPEFFGAYLEFSSVPWVKHVNGDKKGALEPKMKELVYCAFDCASTHLYVPGLKLHMKNALGYGATPQEIIEVLEIATLLSLHTAHVAAPIIAELTAAPSTSS